MPLVRIDLRKGKPVEYVRAVGEAVHRAIVEVLAAPARDNFQMITERDPDHLLYSPDYLDIARSADCHIRAGNLVVWRGRGQQAGVLRTCPRAAEREAESAPRGRGDQLS